MSYKLYKGNLFDTTCNIIGHGVNCKGGFGSGVAGQIASTFPDVRSKYLLKHKRGGWKLGEVQFVEIPYLINGTLKRWFANMATQDFYGREPDKIYVDYPSVGKCLNQVLDFAEANRLSVAIPKVGCGLAGGSWDIINKIIQECLQERHVYLEVWEL